MTDLEQRRDRGEGRGPAVCAPAQAGGGERRRRLEGHSTAEMARQLGLDANVLRVRLSRLRQRLRERGVLTDWL